jgi:glycosyltransferase involved in cell wall biosynthesis
LDYEARVTEARVGIDVRMVGSPGVGTYLRHLVPLIVAARPTWRFTLFGETQTIGQLGWLEHDNVAARELAAPIYSVSEQIALLRAGNRGFDAFWSPHYNVPIVAPAPLLVTVHDVIHLARPEFTRQFAKHAYARMMFERVRRRAAAIVTVSEFTKQEFLRLVGESRAPMTVARNGVDRTWFVKRPVEPAWQGRPYLLSVGSMKPHKNLPALINAFASIRHLVPHELLLVGRWKDMRTLDSRVPAVAAEVGDRVRHLGEVSEPELRALVAGAAVFVHPSLYEGFGLPPLEAMAAGVPCIVARAASMPEVCGDAAVYCDPRDPGDIARRLYEVLTDDALRADLSQRGPQRAKDFDWRRSAEIVLGEFDRVVS